jgi:hypothetical protein
VTNNEETQDGDMTAFFSTGDASGNSSSQYSNSDDIGEVPTDDNAVREEIRHGLQLASEARSVVEAAYKPLLLRQILLFIQNLILRRQYWLT